MDIIYSHPAFFDTANSLKNEFKDDTTNTVIILGACGLSKTQNIDFYKKKYKKVIVFNQEPLTATQKNFMHKNFFIWLNKADEVWDYDEQNIDVIKLFRSDVKLHILKAYKQWPNTYKKDIDILFYGSLNEHRIKLLNHLKTKYNVYEVLDIYSKDAQRLDELILRSKILLNIHYYYECAMQEQARMVRWLGAPCRIISEKSNKNYLGVEEMTYAELFNI